MDMQSMNDYISFQPSTLSEVNQTILNNESLRNLLRLEEIIEITEHIENSSEEEVNKMIKELIAEAVSLTTEFVELQSAYIWDLFRTPSAVTQTHDRIREILNEIDMINSSTQLQTSLIREQFLFLHIYFRNWQKQIDDHPNDRQIDDPPNDKQIDDPPNDKQIDDHPNDRQIDDPPNDKQSDDHPNDKDREKVLVHGYNLCDGQSIMNFKFTHDTVHFIFSRGVHNLIDTFIDLFHGSLKPEDLLPIEVMEYEGNYWVVNGNRRLLLYKKLLESKDKHLIKFPVVKMDFDGVIFCKKKTTKVNGEYVEIRHLGMQEFNNRINQRLSLNRTPS
eukprot:GHVR01163984.1.p1 GENE.GHVR01163984.1~~GHVR01163984.1.p1  ORF type:complete len:333 (+),score=38.74 GHVR01163984.1:151-1149(+)